MGFLKRYMKAVIAVPALVLFIWSGSAVHAQQDSPVEFEADSVSVNNQDGTMIATGNVTITQQGDVLQADEVIYNPSTQSARAIGNVIITTTDGITHASDEMVLDKNFTHAIAKPLLTKLSDGTRFSAASGEHEQNKRTVFDRSVFSPCRCDYDAGESPIWDLRATRSTHDFENRIITHENVTMRILGLPVFYLPLLAHPDETVKRKSGFLTPDVAYSNDRGMTVTTPYYQVLSPTSDVELQPTNYQFRGQGLKTIYRQRWDDSELDATVYTANLETYKKQREMVGATDTRFKTKLGEGWQLDMRLYRTSQDTFLRRYRYTTDQRLDSYVKAQKISDDRYYLVKASDTQGLRETDTPDKEPVLLPFIYYDKVSDGPFANQTIRKELSALQLDNDEGHEMVRWTGLLGTRYQHKYNNHIFTTTGDLLGSYHDIHANGTDPEKVNELGQAQVIVTGEWQYPLGITYGEGDRASAIISPKIKLTGIEGSNRTEHIPNRDAADFRLDEANMFLANRFQGRDFILPGSHVAAGLSGVTEHPFLGDVNGFVGLSYRTTGSSPTSISSDSRDSYSDYVASLSAKTPFNLTLSWSGRADHKTLELNESRSNAVYNRAGTFLEVTHTQVAESYFVNSTEDREEATINLTQSLGGGLSVTAEQVWNLSEGQSKKDQSILSVGWAGGFQDCVGLSLEYKRDPYAERDIKKVSEVQLRLSFKHLGAITQ